MVKLKYVLSYIVLCAKLLNKEIMNNGFSYCRFPALPSQEPPHCVGLGDLQPGGRGVGRSRRLHQGPGLPGRLEADGHGCLSVGICELRINVDAYNYAFKCKSTIF